MASNTRKHVASRGWAVVEESIWWSPAAKERACGFVRRALSLDGACLVERLGMPLLNWNPLIVEQFQQVRGQSKATSTEKAHMLVSTATRAFRNRAKRTRRRKSRQLSLSEQITIFLVRPFSRVRAQLHPCKPRLTCRFPGLQCCVRSGRENQEALATKLGARTYASAFGAHSLRPQPITPKFVRFFQRRVGRPTLDLKSQSFRDEPQRQTISRYSGNPSGY